MSNPIPYNVVKGDLYKSVFFVILIFVYSPFINFIFSLLFKNKEASSVTSVLLFFDKLYKVLKLKH